MTLKQPNLHTGLLDQVSRHLAPIVQNGGIFVVHLQTLAFWFMTVLAIGNSTNNNLHRSDNNGFTFLGVTFLALFGMRIEAGEGDRLVQNNIR